MITNKKLNVILIGIGVVLLIILFNVFYIYRRNEASKINFSVSSLNDTTWANENVRLSFKNKNLVFKINDEEVINSEYQLNNRTGKFTLDDDIEFYLRSINEYSIIVWYKEAEYNLEKEEIAR
ncbi:MAG: hypothetical protein OSJ65_07805 [Bacilli bacterium]|nr:hypothetical protein [Bacilli bacterium]